VSTTFGASKAPAGSAGDDWLWRVAVAGAVLLCVGCLVVPLDRVVVRTLVSVGGDVLAVLAIVMGVRRHSPRVPTAWLLLAGGLAMWAVGDLIWGVYQAHDEEPFVSWSDPFYLLGYPMMAAGLLIASRARSPGFDARSIIDPAIITVAVGFAAGVFIVAPVLDDPSVHGLEKIVAVSYPVGDVLVIAVATRLILDSQWRDFSLAMLLAGLSLVFVGDLWYALAGEDKIFALPVADTLLLAGVVSIGLAGLHPSMRALTERHAEMAAESVAVRLGVAVGAIVTVPLVLLIQVMRGGSLYPIGAVAATTLLAALVVIRYALSAARARRSAAREETLRRYAVDLLAAHGTDDLYRVAEKAADDLAGDASAAIVQAAQAPAAGPEALTFPVEVGGEPQALILVSGPRAKLEAELETRHNALASVAAQLSLALERQRLRAQEHDAVRTLNEQNERLRELDRMKDQFVSSVSHELRSPLTSIVGYVELLVRGEVGELNDDQREFLDIVDRNCTRLTKLVDDILFVARVDAGRLSLSLDWIDVAEVAATSVQSAGPAAEGKDVDLRLDAAPGMPPLWADATRIGQLLDNLISNAVKFTPEGGAVTVAVAQQDSSAHLEVRDTGVGIPPDEVDQLFVRFFRASTSSVAAGTGLGLSITKSIVEAHRGTITVESELGGGTTFLVDLPLEAPPPRASAPDRRGATA
jgi:signal transduction histidine kinase